MRSMKDYYVKDYYVLLVRKKTVASLATLWGLSNMRKTLNSK